jgi:hypothetical protein
MEIISNEKLIRRNARIGQFSSIAGLLILAGGMFVSFTRQDLFFISMMALLLGFILSQIGIFFGNRWGRRPRPDEMISQALKGLDGRYSLYHYASPTSHLLVGPAGVWVLMPRHQAGTITYDPVRHRWKQKGGNLYLKIFAQEGLGRPDLEIGSEVASVQTFLKKNLPDGKVPEVRAALVFTNDRASVEAEDAPVPTLQAKRLKELIRKQAKSKPLSPDQLAEVKKALQPFQPQAED